MNSLVFLLSRSIKNTFLETLRKPSKLIVWIFVFAMIVVFFILSMVSSQSSNGPHDLVWMKGVIFLLVTIFVLIAIQKGLSNGDVIFDMNDVNLLFVSPVSSRAILIYGTVRMAKTAFAAGFFILFQGGSLGNGFGIGYGAVLLILLGFVLSVSMLQILSLLIYSLTNGRPKRKLAVRLISAAAFTPLAVYICLQLFKTGAILPALENALHSPFTSWTPVAGWASAGVASLISGDIGTGLMFLGLILLAGALLLLYIFLSDPDYYEDVLVATETAFEKKRALSEGQINTEASSPKKVKISATGIAGFGASAVFYKHLRESFRANRLGLWGLSSVITALGAVVLALIIRGEAGAPVILLSILMWTQVFFIGTGRGLRELYMHYIYLIPESSFRKIVWSNLELAFKVLIESLVTFSAAGAILKTPVLLIALAIAVYTLFSFLLLGINYLSLRWTEIDISAGILALLYMIAVIVIMLPGLIPAIIVGSMFKDAGIYIGLVILGAWELIAALGCFAMSKGILHRCDMPVLKIGKPQ